MPITNQELNHLAGKGVVVRHWYAGPDNNGKANVSTSLPSDDELALWADAAFTNGGPLVKVELVWSPDEAAKMVMAAQLE
jgi:hypothetical protein